MSQHIVTRIDLTIPAHRSALVFLLDLYARDETGLGMGLADTVKASLPDMLASRAHYAGWIAWVNGQAAGLVNCFEGVSTFRAQPLLNIHDIVVAPAFRRRGIAKALLEAVESEARQSGCCKLTLEVLEGNLPAIKAYREAGFKPYGLDPQLGSARFFEKKFYGD